MAVYSRGVAEGAWGHELLSHLLLLSSLPPDVRNVALDLDHLWQALTAWRNRARRCCRPTPACKASRPAYDRLMREIDAAGYHCDARVLNAAD